MSENRITEKVEDVLRDPMIPKAIKKEIRTAIEASTYPLTHVTFKIGDGGVPELARPLPFVYTLPARELSQQSDPGADDYIKTHGEWFD